MKKTLLSLFIFLSVSDFVWSQCSPVSCISSLPAYGGVCDSSITDGRVNQPYYDFISFHVTNACVDAGLIDPGSSGVGIRVTQLHSFNFTGLPNGITGVTNQPSYVPNANGCASFTGTPTEAGVFGAQVGFLLDVNTWPLSVTCGGIFPPIAQNNNPVSSDLAITILPDPSFTGLDSLVCILGPDYTLLPTGTLGGVFYGPGVNGNIFSPNAAGLGAHTITYVVSAQEGAAYAPTTDSTIFIVQVDGCVGLNESSDDYSVSYPYPIPSNENLNIDFSSKNNLTGTYRIFDLLGKTHSIKEFYVPAGKTTHLINIENLVSGVFLIEISTAGSTRVFRFVKSHD
jgi:hypothetical protein